MNQVDNSPIHTTQPYRFPILIWLLFALLAVGVAAFFAPPKNNAQFYQYGFLPADHPIDVVSDQSGRWFYYFMDRLPGGVPRLAAQVRQELLPQGFTEDTSSRPWFRFVKGNREVIVCNHDEIGWNAPRLVHSPSVIQAGRILWPVLWVHQPGADPSGVARFQVKKLLLRW